MGKFISEIARVLIGTLPPRNLDNSILQRIAQLLPNILQAFALIISHYDPHQAHQEVIYQDVIYFVHKHHISVDPPPNNLHQGIIPLTPDHPQSYH